jgi:putative transposase
MFIEPSKPTQNAYIESFNRTYREEVLDLYLSRTLHEVRKITHQWLVRYNDTWPHDALGRMSPIAYADRAQLSPYELSTCQGNLRVRFISPLVRRVRFTVYKLPKPNFNT